MGDIVQYSIDIRDCDNANSEDIARVLRDAGYEVLGTEWRARWTAAGYEQGKPPISSD